MKLIKTKYKLRCEMGGCRNFADYVLQTDVRGIHSGTYVCKHCIDELRRAIAVAEEQEHYPIDGAAETVKKRRLKKSSGEVQGV